MTTVARESKASILQDLTVSIVTFAAADCVELVDSVAVAANVGHGTHVVRFVLKRWCAGDV